MALIDDAFSALTDIKAAFTESDRPGCHIFLASATTRQRREKWIKVNIEGEVGDQLTSLARVTLSKIETRAADDQALAEFDFDAMADGSIGVLRVAEVPAIAEWLAEVPPDDWPVRFDGDEEMLERARLYATRFSFPDGRHLMVFRGSRGLTIMLKKKGVVAAAFSRHRHELTPIDGPVLSFDGQIDFLVWEGILFISNLLTFESVTNIREVTVRKAQEALNAIGARFPFGSNLAELGSAIGQRARLAKKLAAAHQHGLIEDIDPQSLVQRALEKQLRIDCRMRDGNAYINVDPNNRGQVEDFVDLMTDLFLKSPVTQREWEAVVKRAPRVRV